LVENDAIAREKAKNLLKELFQFDNEDLDFGIYRVMNFKRKEIEKFIEEDLIKAAEERFREYAQVGMADLHKEAEQLRAEIIQDFGEGTIDDQGTVRKHEDAPKIREYLRKMKELENARLTQAQTDDVFNHIYEFFSRYYDKGDFISKRRYSSREKYYVPYNGEEVLFHWANNDQYYVKSGEYFKKYSFKAGGYQVNFILREAEAKLNNVKDESKYFFLCDEDAFKLDEEKIELNIFFQWRALSDEEKKKYGTRNVQENVASDAINRLLTKITDKNLGFELRRKVDEQKTLLEKHLKKYLERNTTDYFIHNNLKVFLERELDFYLKNEVLDLDEIESMNERRIRLNKAKMRAIREISRKIIEFLAQIEDFQKNLFKKKKLVLKTDYCITLDLVPEEFYEEIGENALQVDEWKKQFKLDELTKNTLESTSDKKKLDANFLKTHRYLALDTKFFDQQFKDRLLATFDNLDEKIGGVMIKSDNFHALNLFMTKFKEKIKCVYIDPPYNTGNDGFCYKDNYQHSSWIAMMDNRLRLAEELLSKEGLIFVSIDDNEAHNLRLLMNDIFKGGFKNNIVFRRGIKSVQAQFETVDSLTVGHEYVLMYAKSPEARFKKLYIYLEKKKPGSWNNHWRGTDRPTMRYELFGIVPSTGQWRWSQERSLRAIANYERMLKELQLKPDEVTQEQIDEWYAKECSKTGEEIDLLRASPATGKPEHYISPTDKKLGSDLWIDITTKGTTEVERLFGCRVFDNPKPVPLLERIIEFATEDSDYVLDFFAGSGTTAHAILKLNFEKGSSRKYILVDFADYFEEVMKPRILKLMFSREWKDGLPSSKQGTSHMFKYLYLEQYEDTLNNIVFRESDKSVQETLDSFRDYFLRYMLDYETRESPTRLIIDKFQTPFDYKIKTISENEEREETVDLVETFNYLLGLNVERLRAFNDGERIYRIVFGGQENKSVVIIWRNTKNLDLEKDKKFIEEKILSGNTYDLIFVNGDSYIKNAKPIEPEFKRLMGA
jgi:adenine-specific DNA-methyltransferase